MRLSRNVWAGLVLTAIGMAIVLILIPYGVVEPRKVKYAALSPSYYPRIVAIALVLLGIVVAVRGGLEKPQNETKDLGRRPDATVRIVSVLALLTVYALLVEPLGFVLSSMLALTCLTLLAGERKVALIAPIVILLPFGLYFFFVKVANIPIPTGILKPLLVGS